MPEQDVSIESPEVLSRKLLDAIVAAPEGYLKNASDASSQMIRRRLRETGFTRLIIPHKPVSDSDLNMLPDTELPVIIEEMEPDSPGAKSISFNDSADTAFYRGDKFVVFFCHESRRLVGGLVKFKARIGRSVCRGAVAFTDSRPPGLALRAQEDAVAEFGGIE